MPQDEQPSPYRVKFLMMIAQQYHLTKEKFLEVLTEGYANQGKLLSEDILKKTQQSTDAQSRIDSLSTAMESQTKDLRKESKGKRSEEEDRRDALRDYIENEQLALQERVAKPLAALVAASISLSASFIKKTTLIRKCWQRATPSSPTMTVFNHAKTPMAS